VADSKAKLAALKARGTFKRRNPSGRKGRDSRRQLDAKRKATGDLAPLDDTTADQLAKFLHAGISAYEALAHLRPGIDDDEVRRELATKWAGTRTLSDAIDRLNGGPWVDMTEDQRLEIAQARHYSELAYFIMSHSVEEAAGLDYKKLIDAREAIAQRLAGQEGRGDAFDQFMRKLVSGEVQLNVPLHPGLVSDEPPPAPH
jgi:hypothetical protein